MLLLGNDLERSIFVKERVGLDLKRSSQRTKNK